MGVIWESYEYRRFIHCRLKSQLSIKRCGLLQHAIAMLCILLYNIFVVLYIRRVLCSTQHVGQVWKASQSLLYCGLFAYCTCILKGYPFARRQFRFLCRGRRRADRRIGHGSPCALHRQPIIRGRRRHHRRPNPLHGHSVAIYRSARRLRDWSADHGRRAHSRLCPYILRRYAHRLQGRRVHRRRPYWRRSCGLHARGEDWRWWVRAHKRGRRRLEKVKTAEIRFKGLLYQFWLYFRWRGQGSKCRARIDDR